ncbi:SDR family NAD(P)-dependent oxidoreductase [Brevibacterium casei]|nr:SDR family NAD(P)-dependent oxidoreductase [Brevibacterium casei]
MTDTAQAPPEERIALVTGATGAIGAAVSRALVGQGIRTAMLARNLRRLERLAEQLDAPDLTLPVRADVTQPFDLVEARDAIRDRFGADPDLVMVSAGVMRAGDFEQAVPSEWKAMIMTNVEGALYTAQTFADGLLRIGETGHRADLIFVGSAPAPRGRRATRSSLRWRPPSSGSPNTCAPSTANAVCACTTSPRSTSPPNSAPT